MPPARPPLVPSRSTNRDEERAKEGISEQQTVDRQRSVACRGATWQSPPPRRARRRSRRAHGSSDVALARAATAKYVTNLALAKAERLRDHHEDDPEHGLPLHEPEGEGVRRPRSRRSSCTSTTAALAARRGRVGLHRRSRRRRRSPARRTARSAPAATTRTGRSSRRRRRARARRRRPAPAPPSTSGTRT